MGQSLTVSLSTVSSSGSVAAGKRYIEFILSSDFAGTIGGQIIAGSAFAVYGPLRAPDGSVFGVLNYTISAGSAVITTY